MNEEDGFSESDRTMRAVNTIYLCHFIRTLKHNQLNYSGFREWKFEKVAIYTKFYGLCCVSEKSSKF